MSSLSGGAAPAIEPMAERDLAEAVEIDLESFAPGELGAGVEDPRVTRERSLREELVRPWSRVRAARDEAGGVLGYALFWLVVDEVQLLNVAVAMGARRRGIGRALVLDMLAYARERGAVRVLLEVRSSNAPAIALYERLGFERFNVRERYYADGEDAIEMQLAL